MRFAVNRTALAHANACLTIMGIHMKAVGLNVLLALIVRRIKLVFEINAKTLVLDYVLKMLNAVS